MYWESAIWFPQSLILPLIRFPLLILDKSPQIKKISYIFMNPTNSLSYVLNESHNNNKPHKYR